MLNSSFKPFVVPQSEDISGNILQEEGCCNTLRIFSASSDLRTKFQESLECHSLRGDAGVSMLCPEQMTGA